MFEGLEPQHTKIEKVISIKLGNIILEAHGGYPLDESNLYLVAESGEIIWYAERPAPDAHYIRVKLGDDGTRLSAYTTGRHACEIEVKSGRILSQIEFR